MKYALLADVHSNLEALEAILEDMKTQGCTHAACLGDIVSDAANPKECIDIIRGMNIPCVRGNRDEYCATEMPVDAFGPRIAKSVAWTREQLTAEDREWLRSLPLTLVVDGFTIVHATLESPWRWGYVFDRLAAASSLSLHGTPVCFNGHTHVPVAFVRDSVVRGSTYSKFRIEQGKQYLINVGSVGQPRDGDPRAAYATYDMEAQRIELRRVNYDIPGAQGKIAALPFWPP